MCIYIVEIWFGITNGQFLCLSARRLWLGVIVLRFYLTDEMCKIGHILLDDPKKGEEQLGLSVVIFL